MSRTTNRSQNAGAPNVVRTAKRTAVPAGGGSPAPPANAFLGKPERVPETAFVREKAGDGFLTSAKTYYELFGIDVAPIDSIEQVVVQIANSMTVWRRIALVSHAHPRGMIIPFFTGGVRGTNKELFIEFAKSDLDGLKLLSPFPPASPHLFNWSSILSILMGHVRTANASVLQPFGLQSSGNPTGDLFEYVRFAFDIVYLRDPLRVRRNDQQEAGTAGIDGPQRNILENFVREILTQMRPQVASSTGASPAQIDALRDVILGLTYNTLRPNLDNTVHPHLGLDNDSVNDFPTLKAVVTAIQNEFRKKLNVARTKMDDATIIDIRGCRAGEDVDYVEAIRTFFGTASKKPVVSAPRHFQQYPGLDFKVMASRADIKNWIGQTRFSMTPAKLKEAFRKWAVLIAVDPLHVRFWSDLFKGPAATFEALSWRNSVPPLFIPTPGIEDLKTLTLANVIGKLKDYFNVAAGDVPSASDLGDPAKRPTALKKFMTAAQDSLENGDGLYYYMLYAGLPVFVHGTPELAKNGLVVWGAHKQDAMQSWYKCLWKDPLPSQGPYKTAKIDVAKFRQVTSLVGTDRTEIVSVCPIPRYRNCMRTRPFVSDVDESAC